MKEWLFNEVADDNDIIVDEMQKDFMGFYNENDDFEGTQEYKKNIKHIETGIADLKTPKGIQKMKVGTTKQKITDGIQTCWYGGQKDAQDLPSGEGMLKYENGDTFHGTFSGGILNRTGKILRAKENCLHTEGQWVDSLMEGEMRVETLAGGWIEGYWSKGVPHGFQREFGPKDLKCKNMLKAVGRYHRGMRRGFWWKGCFGGAFIAGYVDPEDGTFSGDDLAYIYPDFKMVLRGSFKDEKLVEGQMCELIGSTLEKGIRIPIFSPKAGPVYTFEHPSRKVIAKNPLVADPWESEMVYVKESLLPQGGEGLFAKKDIGPKELLSLFNGVRLNVASLHAKYGDSDYRIRLHADTDLDIPEGYQNLDQYCSTLGHKANHSNCPNAEWALVEHPRFGLIRGLASQGEIKKDDEVLVNYQMNLADSPEWYRIVWLRHQREFKKMKDDAIERVLARYYENTGKRVELPEEEGFVVPDPKGVDDGSDNEDEEGKLELAHQDMVDEIDKMKKLMKIKGSSQSNDPLNEGPKIVELNGLDA